MRVLLQRVSHAKVTVDGKEVSAIGPGLLLLAGAGPSDTPAALTAMAAKIAGLRIFPDEAGKMNLSLLDCGGAAMVVSQFTLYADCRKGRRPSFTNAAAPEKANQLIDVFCQALREAGISQVAQGMFGADMKVSLCNDGPVTIWLDSSGFGI